MKHYNLKKWYPSLDEKWDTTHRYEYQSSTGYMCNKSIQHCVIIYKKELHPDFWEEKKEPLFVTEDGVELFDKNINFIVVDCDFEKFIVSYVELAKPLNTDKFIYFAHESNADDYILRNKPVFSYEDFIRWGNVPYERVIMQLAKERI